MYALITGSSKGIGKAFAIELAKKNYDLLLVARSGDLLLKVANEIKQQYAVKVETLALDLSSNDAALKLKKFCETNKLNISVLVNNAGYGLSGNFEKFSLEENTNMMQLNMISLAQITQAFIPILEKNEQSYILNVASTTAYQAIPGLSIYSATKAFVLSFSRGLYHELKPKNISVTALSPGSTDTDFVNRAQINEKAMKAAEKVNMTPEAVAKIGLEAMFDKKPEVVAGLINKIGAAGAWLLPKGIIEKIAGAIYV
jgi:uncharacterized protein